MDRAKLKEEIIADEGMVKHIYLDHLGYPTFGVGHLILQSDPESGKPTGTEVSEERIRECLEKDLDTVLKDCKILYPDFDDLPEEVQHILCNMMFNMGFTRMSKFRKLKANIEKKNWSGASEEMKSSKWYTQVTNRAERLVKRMKAVGE